MNISMIPTFAAPQRPTDMPMATALPGFGDLLDGAVADFATMRASESGIGQGAPAPLLATAASGLGAPAMPEGEMVLQAQPVATPQTAALAAEAAALPAMPTPPAPDGAPDAAAQPLFESGPRADLPAEQGKMPTPAEHPDSGHGSKPTQLGMPAPATGEDQLALNLVAAPIKPLPEEASQQPPAPGTGSEEQNVELPVPTLPEAARPAQAGPDAIMPQIAPVATPMAASPAPLDQAVMPSVDSDGAEQPAAPKTEVAVAAATHDAADATGPMGGERPSQALPSSLFSQTLASQAARPVEQPYPAAAPHVPHQPVITAQPGQIGRDMGVEIARQVAAGKEEVLIRLDPAEMGRIDVRLSFDREGSLRAVMVADSPVALDMLRREAGDLSRALADAGVRADPQSFRFDSRGGEAGQSGHRGQQGGDARGGQGGLAQNGRDGAADEPAYQSLRTSGRVDLMA